MKARHHRTQRDTDDFGGIAVRKIGDVDQLDRLSEASGERSERALHRRRETLVSLARLGQRPGAGIVGEVFERPTLAPGATAAGYEHAEQNALQPRSQVRALLVLAFEAKRPLDRILQHVLGDGVVARKAKRA